MLPSRETIENKYIYRSDVDGSYSDFDCNMLFWFMRELDPANVLEIGCRFGKTTLCILDSVDFLEYDLFEKEQNSSIMSKVHSRKRSNNLTIHGNVIGGLDGIRDIEYLHVDGLHDYVFAKWYIDNLFPLVVPGGVIHIHDIYYDKYGNGWNDINPAEHQSPNMVDSERIRSFYPTIIGQYEKPGPVTENEETVIRDFVLKNNWKFFSTLPAFREYGFEETFTPIRTKSCSLYLEKP